MATVKGLPDEQLNALVNCISLEIDWIPWYTGVGQHVGCSTCSLAPLPGTDSPGILALVEYARRPPVRGRGAVALPLKAIQGEENRGQANGR